MNEFKRGSEWGNGTIGGMTPTGRQEKQINYFRFEPLILRTLRKDAIEGCSGERIRELFP
jgi:hypothetical protein